LRRERIRSPRAAGGQALLDCARAFHREDGHPLPAAGEAALTALIDRDTDGCIVVLEIEGAIGGYAVACYGYSVEYGGRDGFIDDIYVTPALRHRGHGRRLFEAAERQARAAGCRALHLEVMTDNPMSEWYRSFGYRERGSTLFSKRFDRP
jgi:ribosomal protein S18 acetylase RimI-like enzyme